MCTLVLKGADVLLFACRGMGNCGIDPASPAIRGPGHGGMPSPMIGAERETLGASRSRSSDPAVHEINDTLMSFLW